MEPPVTPVGLDHLLEQARERAEVIRLRMAWVEERRRELWRRMDLLAAARGRTGSAFGTARAEAAEIDPVRVYPLG